MILKVYQALVNVLSKLTMLFLVNQIWAKNLTSDFPWGDNGGYSGVFGLEAYVNYL